MSSIEHLLLTYGPFFVFIGTLLEGETVVVIAGYFVHQGLLAPFPVVLAAFLGSAACDQTIFFIGRHHLAQSIVNRVESHAYFGRALRIVEKHPTLFILGFRFLYGLRTVGALAISLTTVPTARFVVLNLLSAAVWSSAFTLAGYLLGRTVETVFGRLHAIEHKIIGALAIGLAIFVVYQLVKRWLRR